jgi:NADPH:quinone reductase-like Zn-dependent oxidoreductase
MKAAIAKGGAGIGAIEIRDLREPTPGPGEALVRLHAATLNYRDLIMVKGLLPGLTKQPEFVPLSCAAGEVVAVGENVTRVKPGDHVSPLFGQGWINGPPDPSRMLGGSIDGVARGLGTFDAESLCLLPDALGDLEAAALPCAW